MFKQRSATIKNAQKEAPLEFVQQHPNLQSGRFTKDFTFKKGQQLWELISEILNSMLEGAVKDWRHWRKTWQDMKKNTKAKAVEVKKYAIGTIGTGGGEPSKILLNAIDNKIMDIISPTLTEGLETVSETQAQFEYEDKENMDTINDNTIPVEVISEVVDVVEDHTYNMPEISNRYTSNTHVHPIPRISKTKRLETSLKLTNQLVKGVEKKVDITEAYYETKKEYYQHRIEYEKNKLKLLEVQNNIASKVLEVLNHIVKDQ
ncbi:Myb/SANT-like DNA-binding domain [Popillia japonica]|uniref:Regulatory protein zeste n=1 Tax=Popillia japonica TaxID=7064 RepID=A0AAW1K0S7_POPJA